jgi:1-acyl-sn-glycerol-3-phosphate acyltransferase
MSSSRSRTFGLRQRVFNNTIARTILSIWAWLVMGTMVILWLPLMAIVRVVTAPFDRGRYWTGYLFRKLPVIHQKLNPLWSFSTSGAIPNDPRKPFVVVSNHESFVDILLICHLPFEMKWLSKVENFRIPVMGWLMMLAGDVRLTRGEVGSAADAMRQCADRLEKKVSVLIFPEGTRSKTGELGKFKNGAFRLAIDTGCDILPVVVSGCRDALPPKDWRFGVSRAEVRVLEPISVAGLTMDDLYTLRDRTRDAIGAEVKKLRAELSA